MDKSEKIFLYLPKTEVRPEEFRVIKHDVLELYLVQSFSDKRQKWITQKEWVELEEAIADALNWYPMPIPTLERLFAGFLEHLPRVGNVNWLIYDDSGVEHQINQRMTYEAFMKVRELLSADESFEPGICGETDCIFYLPKTDLFNCKGKFTSDFDYFNCRPCTADNAENLVTEIKSDIQEHFGEEMGDWKES